MRRAGNERAHEETKARLEALLSHVGVDIGRDGHRQAPHAQNEASFRRPAAAAAAASAPLPPPPPQCQGPTDVIQFVSRPAEAVAGERGGAGAGAEARDESEEGRLERGRRLAKEQAGGVGAGEPPIAGRASPRARRMLAGCRREACLAAALAGCPPAADAPCPPCRLPRASSPLPAAHFV